MPQGSKILSSGLVSGQNLSAASLPLCPLPDRKQSQQFETLWGLIPGSWNRFLKPYLMWKRTWTCPSDVVQVSRRREWDCPLPCRSPAMFAQFCEDMVVHLLSSASPKTTQVASQVAYLGEWATVGAIFSAFCPWVEAHFVTQGTYMWKLLDSLFSQSGLPKNPQVCKLPCALKSLTTPHRSTSDIWPDVYLNVILFLTVFAVESINFRALWVITLSEQGWIAKGRPQGHCLMLTPLKLWGISQTPSTPSYGSAYQELLHRQHLVSGIGSKIP